MALVYLNLITKLKFKQILNLVTKMCLKDMSVKIHFKNSQLRIKLFF